MAEAMQFNYWLTWTAGFLVGVGVTALVALIVSARREHND